MEGISLNFNTNSNSNSSQSNGNSLQSFTINTGGSGSYLFNYTPETYEKQKIIQILSNIVGIASAVFAFLGLLIPGGKLIAL